MQMNKKTNIGKYIAKTILFFVCVQLLICQNIHGQPFYRIKADFTIKIKAINGMQQLIMGKVYYDTHFEKLVHEISFPNKETWVTYDTTTYCFKEKQLTNKETIPAITRFSIFHMALTGQLPDFGLKKSSFKMIQLEKKEDLVITTWEPPHNYSQIIGKIMISNQDKKLHGVVYFDSNNHIINKQFFSKYQTINGFNFPSEVLQITYADGKESYEMSTYKNITINESLNENTYNHPLTSFK